MAKAKRVRSNEKNVDAVRFVTVVRDVHARGGTHADVAAELGLKVGSVATRISQLRNRKPVGVNMPDFPRGGGGGSKLDVDALNAILEG